MGVEKERCRGKKEVGVAIQRLRSMGCLPTGSLPKLTPQSLYVHTITHIGNLFQKMHCHAPKQLWLFCAYYCTKEANPTGQNWLCGAYGGHSCLVYWHINMEVVHVSGNICSQKWYMSQKREFISQYQIFSRNHKNICISTNITADTSIRNIVLLREVKCVNFFFKTESRREANIKSEI